jgi:Uma2 family endonuclease
MMSYPQPHHVWTVTEYLAWEPQQEVRHEFDGFEPVAMVGGTAAHHRIIRNGEAALRTRLRRCEVFRETMKLRLESTYRYPDLMVVCSPIPGSVTEVADPVVVIEVLSEGNAREDRIIKNEEYHRTPSIQHYVMLEQDSIAATVFVRSGDDWIGRVMTGPEAVLAFPEIEVEVPLAEFYVGVLD